MVCAFVICYNKPPILYFSIGKGGTRTNSVFANYGVGDFGNPFVWKRGFRGRGWRGGKRGH